MAKKPTFDTFLEAHECQLLVSGVPQLFWSKLFEKLENEVLDAGNSFQMIFEEGENGGSSWSVHAVKDLSVNDENNIYLIDHAWTFRPNTARTALAEVEGLQERMAAIFNLEATDLDAEEANGRTTGSEYSASEGEESGTEQAPTSSGCNKTKRARLVEDAGQKDDTVVEKILNKLWCYAQTYTINMRERVRDENDIPVWYVPDEFGARIGHSLTPNARVIPFFYAFNGVAYSLLFPTMDIKDQEEVTRNFIENKLYREHPEWRDILLLPWNPEWSSGAEGGALAYCHRPKGAEYFASGRVSDELPTKQPVRIKHQLGDAGGDKVKIFTDNDQLVKRLRRIQVELVDSPLKADIVWMHEHFHEFRQLADLNQNALVNQFPYESALTVKDLFAAAVQVYGDPEGLDPEKIAEKVSWFPTTFNLNDELLAFITYYKHREAKGLDNTWIIKPYNLARSLDMHVTRNLSCCIRMAESGPKVACKYIHNPLLFVREDSGNKVKFDLRYIVLLKSLKEPLEAYMYKNFWVRFAVNEFNLLKLDDSFTHMSVHNYSDASKVLNMKSEDFIQQLEIMYPGRIRWTNVQAKINNVIKETFKVASAMDAPCGMVPNCQSRAMYGFDIMLKWKDETQSEVEACFLEANFMPDCERACDFYPDFADTVFGALFLDEETDKITKL